MPNQPATLVYSVSKAGRPKGLSSWQPVIASPSHPNKDGRATDSAVLPLLGLISVVY